MHPGAPPSRGPVAPVIRAASARVHAYLARATRPATVTPFSSYTWSPGAERPKSSTPRTLSANLYQPEVTPASHAVVADFMAFGRTSSLYSADWRSKASTHGIETTR